MVLSPGHIKPIGRQHAKYAIFGESFAMGKLGYPVETPSLRFGIVKALGLVLGQEYGRAVHGIASLLG